MGADIVRRAPSPRCAIQIIIHRSECRFFRPQAVVDAGVRTTEKRAENLCAHKAAHRCVNAKKAKTQDTDVDVGLWSEEAYRLTVNIVKRHKHRK